MERWKPSNSTIIGFAGTTLSDQEEKLIRKFDPAGIILFERNVESITQLTQLVERLRSIEGCFRCARFVCLDFEGGRVNRLSGVGIQSASAAELGLGEPKDTEASAFEQGVVLRQLGITLNLAPIADLLNSESKVLQGRAFSEDPHRVAEHVISSMRGFSRANVNCCVKHFPGHGATFQDTHYEVSSSSISMEALTSSHLVPFKLAIEKQCDAIMLAHVIYSQSPDGETPASLSKYWITQVLRKQLNYQGALISDGLEMEAVSKSADLPTIGAKALEAGTDFLIFYLPEGLGQTLAVLNSKAEHIDIWQHESRAQSFRLKFSE